MELLEIMKNRYSVRSFKKEPISDQDLNSILEVVKYAPTAKNNQPQKIYVIRNKEKINQLSSICRCIYDAPTVLVVGYDKNQAWVNKRIEGYCSGETDASIVLTHIMLRAFELNVGSVWVGMFNDEEVRTTLELEENIQITALMPIGYISEDSKPIQMHYDTKELKEMVEFVDLKKVP